MAQASTTKSGVKLKRERIVYCCGCCREYSSNKFYEIPTEHNHGFMDYCSECTEEILKKYLADKGSLETALWYTCAKLDVPFIKRVYEATLKAKNNKPKSKDEIDLNIFDLYYGYLWGKYSLKKVTDEWTDFTNTDTDYKDIVTLEKSDESIQIEVEKLRLNWGDQDDIEDYKFLEYTYDRYTKNVEFENPQQEDLYRDLCKARLEMRKIESSRSDGDLTKTQSRILTLMNKLKLDEFESNKAKTLSEQLIFAKIAQIEQTKPADLYKDYNKYRDTSKLRKYYKDLVLRPLLNTLAGKRDFDISMDDIEQYNLDE